MGSSNTAASQQQAQAHARSQQQAQAALQAAHQAQQPMQQNWYPGMPTQPTQPLDVTGMPQTNFDLNFDFTQFDLGTGSDADLSALFIPDSMMWGQPVADPNMGYNGF